MVRGWDGVVEVIIRGAMEVVVEDEEEEEEVRGVQLPLLRVRCSPRRMWEIVGRGHSVVEQG